MTEDGAEPTIVRAPNHLGDLVLALPALAAAGADVMVLRSLTPILEMAGVRGDVLPLDRGPAGFVAAVRALRRKGCRRGVLMSAAFSAAWLFRWGGVGRLRGTRTDGRGWLLTERIEPEALRGRHRVEGFALLAGLDDGRPLPPPRVTPPADRVDRWRASLPKGALVGLFPGANAPARRWPVERFAEVAHVLVSQGVHVVALGGRSERALTARVGESEGAALDLGGRTDLVDLAAILSVCDLVITNDTGPMHLAGAVGTATVSLWGSSDPCEVRQTGAGDTPVTGADLPCKPCYRNECHRRGPGTLLPDAHEECMRLIETQDVMNATLTALAKADAGE
ncbi:MAG: glycosyltransferase family 9 protein [Gemmatimonadota bacterium]|jgi:heptosyltransferase-2